MTNTSLPGAEIALTVIRELTKWPGEIDSENFMTQFRQGRWDNNTGWTTGDPQFITWAACNDTFFWGSGDGEEITEENLPILIDTLAELAPWYTKFRDEWSTLNRERGGDKLTAWIKEWEDAHPDWREKGLAWNTSEEHAEARKPVDAAYRKMSGVETALNDLFAARVRGMRPQGACYNRYPEEIWHLFDAAGPERETGFGNPYNPGEYRR